MGFIAKGNSDATKGGVDANGEASGGAIGKLWEKVVGVIACDVGRIKCWKNGFEHNKLAIFEIKLQWVSQTFFCGSTWECVILHEEMKIIY